MIEGTPTPPLIRVAGIGRPVDVGAAIAGTVRQHGTATIQAIGANAVNQAVKSCIVAGRYLERDGIQIAMLPSFEIVELDGDAKTAIRIEVVKLGGNS